MKAAALVGIALLVVSPTVLITAAVRAEDDKADSGDGPKFRTEIATRGNLTAVVAATGTVEPEEVVDVGAQVTGQVVKLGEDPTDAMKMIDFCTPVQKGMILACIDEAPYKARAAQKEAALKGAEAAVKQAAARKKQADRDCDRAKAVFGKGALTQEDLDRAESEADTAAAAVAVAEAGVLVARADLEEAKLNLDYCTIKSPVDGVVLDRRVNVGQTATASLSAPSLFLLAKDLSRVQVWASVNEADIGNVHKGQDVTFTVDARPGKIYHGIVAQVRYNATVAQNVVTYTVVVETTNPQVDVPQPRKPEAKALLGLTERELLPYLTAHVKLTIARRDDVLLVPNAALEWRPQLAQVAPEFREEYEQLLRGKSPKESKPGAQDGARRVVWVLNGSLVRPIRLQTGLTDGVKTEVVKVREGEVLDEATRLVTGEVQPGDPRSKNPFAPQPIFPKTGDGK